MSLVDAFTYHTREKYQRRARPGAAPGWRVAYGHISQVPEVSSWRDDRFAVIDGQWEFCPTERFVTVGEVRLTNRAELLSEIDRERRRVESAPVPEKIDSEPTDLRLIAMLWTVHGWRTPDSLTGAYAFSVWDRDTHTLWLVRDRVGVQTLYYTREGAVHYAGSRASDVASHLTSEVDLVALRDYLCCAFVPGARTMWRGLGEVRPGTIVRAPEGETTVYWQAEERRANQKLPIEVYSSRLRGSLERAVYDSLPYQEPVGVYLSGGLDSSCVAALAARLHEEPVHSYSIHFGSDCPNELEFSTLVAQHCRTRHHVIEITPEAMWNLLPETMACLDDPIGDPLTVPNVILGRAAKETVSTILNGEGGDPCFGGPKNQPMLLAQLYRPTSALAVTDTRDGQSQQATATPQHLVTSYLASFQKCASDLPLLLRREVWEQVRMKPSVFADAFNSQESYLNNLFFINTRFKGADHILTKVNNLTRAAGLRGHSPLFDDRIVDLSLEIPPEYKLDGACEKAVLKMAVADLLPARILERPKSGMLVPVNRWFREHWRRRASALLLSRHAHTRRFLNQDVVRDWLNYRGDVWARYGIKLWLLISLELWLQTHMRD